MEPAPGQPSQDRSTPKHVLIVGRSPHVLTEAIAMLRAKGYRADATNQFDDVLDDYDVTTIDLVVFGGMVPLDTRRHLEEEIGRRSPRTRIAQGRVGVAEVIVAQVEEHFSGVEAGAAASYDPDPRAVRLTLAQPTPVTVEARWAVLAPPRVTDGALALFDGVLEAGEHRVPVPDEVPAEASFVTVSLGRFVAVLTVGPVPERITKLVPATAAESVLPPVEPVRTGAGRADGERG
jgi:hypothetical protein